MQHSTRSTDLVVIGSVVSMATAVVYLVNGLTRASAYVRVVVEPLGGSDPQEETLQLHRSTATIFAGGLTGGDRAFIHLPLVAVLALVSALLFCAHLQLKRHPTLPPGRALLAPGSAGTAIGVGLAALGVLPAVVSVMTTLVMLNATGLDGTYQPAFSMSWGWIAAGAIFGAALRCARRLVDLPSRTTTNPRQDEPDGGLRAVRPEGLEPPTF